MFTDEHEKCFKEENENGTALITLAAIFLFHLIFFRLVMHLRATILVDIRLHFLCIFFFFAPS